MGRTATLAAAPAAAALLAAAALATGCLPDVKGPYACARSVECPGNMTCEEDRCVAPPADVVEADAAADAPDAPGVPEAPADVPADLPADVPADLPADVAADLAPDAAEDVPEDSPADVPWQRFTDNGDGSVTDHEFGLVWMKEGYEDLLPWDAAAKQCDGITFGGSSEWRLPTLSELRTLVDPALCADTAVGGACPLSDECAPAGTCWRSTPPDPDPCDGCGGMNAVLWPVFDDPSAYVWSSTRGPLAAASTHFKLAGDTGSLHAAPDGGPWLARCVREL
ncbi:MAG: DUF1566 domain-containing protein [Deltaproteobacteria bacterium]|nr:DUF1566 domain-containing protein [Deltaproteobacteria bacterium]